MTDVTAQSNPQNYVGEKRSALSFSGVSIRNLLVGGFSVACLVLIIAMGISILSSNKQATHITEARDITIPTALSISELHRQMVETEANTSKWLSTADPKYTDALSANWSKISVLQSRIDASLSTLGDKYSRGWQEFKVLLQDYKTTQNNVIQNTSAASQLAAMEDKLGTMLVGDAGLMTLAANDLNSSMTALVEEANGLSTTLWALLIVGVFLTVAAGAVSSRAVLAPLADLLILLWKLPKAKRSIFPAWTGKMPSGNLAAACN